MSTSPQPGSTPTTGSAIQDAWRLPPNLLESAARRICVLSVFVAVLIVFVQIVQLQAQPVVAEVLRSTVILAVTGSSVVLAVGLFGLSHFKVVSASTLIGLGMGFEVVVAMTISMIETSLPITHDRPMVGISSVGLWVFAVGVLIPNRPIWTFVTALVAATTWPVAWLINDARLGFDPVPAGQLLAWPVINYLLAFLTFLVGRWTYGTAIAAQTGVDLGSYRLVSSIGEGGMGEVWKAQHQMLARDAAIKLVKPDLVANRSARQAELSVRRFKREANIIASLQSPHTVYLYDFGVSQDGHFYYVMELLDGISLQTLVTTFGPQPAGRVSAILRDVCDSLEEAHQKGMVHRDLKPSNIMLCKLALEHDFTKVLDFGLAKAVGAPDASQLTMDGVTTGTPGYMAPEIAMGNADSDSRADIYALGCVAYFLLTGSLVFEDTNPVSMALKHVQAEPERPSQRTELPIPASLENVVMRCLAKKAADRPATACEVARLVSACDVPSWTADDATGWWERHLPPTSSLRSFAQPSGPIPQVVRRA